MPRQIDSSLLKAKVANNPNNTLSTSGVQGIINNGIANIPALTLQALEAAINTLLTEIDQVTGLNLLALAQALESLFGNGTNLLTQFLSLFGLNSSAPGGGTPALPGIGSIPFLGGVVSEFQSLFDQLVSAGSGVSSTGNSLGGLASLFGGIANNANLSLSTVTNATNILGIRTNKPAFYGIEQTIESAFSLFHLGTGSTPTNFAATSSTAPMSLIRTSSSDLKGFVQWYGSGNSGLTAFYVNFFKLDPATGDLNQIFSSADIHGAISSGWAWNLYTMPGPNQIQVHPGDVIGVELQPVGGTHTVAGVNAPWLTNHPTSDLKRLGVQRNAGSSPPTAGLNIPAATVAGLYNANVPYIGLGISNVPANYEPPQTQTFTSSGTYTALSWQVTGDTLDLIPLGGGGGGGGSIGYGTGAGGNAGAYNPTTLTCGTDYVAGTVFTVTVGAGGGGGGYGSAGAAGSSTTISWTDPSSTPRTRTATGGTGGDSFGGAAPHGAQGDGPGNELFNTQTYIGGTNVASSQNGSPPGGGGGGAFSWLVGANGAGGGAWFTARQH